MKQRELTFRKKCIPANPGDDVNSASCLGEDYHDVMDGNVIVASFVGGKQDALESFARRFIAYDRVLSSAQRE